MGLLGMLAAGAATGARNASNMNTDAINKVEMMQINGQANATAAMIKSKYAAMKFDRETAIKQAEAERSRAHDLDKIDRQSASRKELNDSRLAQQLKLEGVKQGNRVSLAKMKQAEGGVGVLGEYKPMSSEGKAAMDYVKLGKSKDPVEALAEIERQKMLRGIASNNMMMDPEQLLEFERKYKAAKGQRVMEVDEPLIPTFNPKTGQFE